MVDFTPEQLQQIRNSNEFKKFVEKWEQEGIDRNATLNDYLGNALNRSEWEKKFSVNKEDLLQDEQKSTQEELAKAEQELETHLHTVYADGILQAGQDLPEKFWETDDYKRWADNYNDKETHELKDKIQQLQAKNVEKETVYQSQERYVPDLAAALTNHGFKDPTFVDGIYDLLDKVQETDTKAKDFYEAVINAYEQKKGYLKLNDYLKTEEDVRLAENVMRALGYDLPEGTNYQRENSANVEIPVRSQSILVSMPVAPKEKDDTNTIIQDINDDNTNIIIQDINDDNHHEDVIEDFVQETTQERELSDNSDANEDSLNDLKLDVLLELGYIDQPLYDAAKKDSDKAMNTSH